MSDPIETNSQSSEQTATPPPVDAPATASVASVGNRVVAMLIDMIIGMVVSLVPVIGWVATIAYFITRDALPFLDGQSIGKKVMKLRAVDANTGAPLTNNWGASAIRNVVLYIPFFVFVELFVLISNKEQRLGDQWAKTKVVQIG